MHGVARTPDDLSRTRGRQGRISRQRVTVDLRGIDERLHAFAITRRITVAASVRQAIDAMLGADGEADQAPAEDLHRGAGDTLVKVTLRLPAGHARVLATRSRQADVTQGLYVASLIDGVPIPAHAPDHRESLAELIRSTAALAALSHDLHEVLRLRRRGVASDAMRDGSIIDRLDQTIRQHLRIASQHLAHLQPRRSRGVSIGPRGLRP